MEWLDGPVWRCLIPDCEMMPYFGLSGAYSGWFESVVPIQAGLMMPYFRLSIAYSGWFVKCVVAH